MSSGKRGLIVAAAMLGTLVLLGHVAPRVPRAAEGSQMSQPPFPQRYPVAPLPEGIRWLNTDGPRELSDFRGKFVLMDFWTYCCINCMHILPELDKLEEAYPRNLVVVGVHSAKFETEKDTQNIVDAILRYEIKHPVINDANHVLWDRFEVQAWPTVLLIDPEGYAVARASGEITFEQVDAVLRRAIPYYRRKGLLNEKPLVFDKEAARSHGTPLRFPGKILADEATDRLFVADSNHDRIVVTRLDGTLVETIGSGETGLADGDFSTASFNHPQGMALRGNDLYVADTENHAIRKVDLTARTVTTVAGTGTMLHNLQPQNMRAIDATKASLSSPWALWIDKDDLYIAMAGLHQIWRMPLASSRIGPYAGNGREDIVDGPLLPRTPYEPGYASLAQPSGLASDGTWLFVADSEGSSIRAVPLGRTGEVRTVVGTASLPAARLFTFGDVDGSRDRVRFQHPLGIVYYQGTLYVADTYNDKIKAVNPATGAAQTIAGSGPPIAADDAPYEKPFDEPAGITAAAGKLFVADTNNHRVRVIDLTAGNKISTLDIPALAPPQAPAEKHQSPGNSQP